MTNVYDIARHNLVTCKITDDVPTVTKKMIDAEVGSIFVEDLRGKIIGLIPMVRFLDLLLIERTQIEKLLRI